MYVPVVQGLTTVATNPQGYQSPSEYGLSFEEAFVSTSDGEKIHLWLVHPRGRQRGDFVFIECHGNAGNLGLRLPSIAGACQHLGVSVCIFDYRGFGASSGVPSEAGLMRDLQAVHVWLLNKFSADKIILHGRSIGGSLVIQYASRSAASVNEPDAGTAGFRGLIVENTFTSIRDLIKTHFPFLRGLMEVDYLADRLLRLHWKTAEWLPHVKHPLLLVSSLNDEIVPHHHRVHLADLAQAAGVRCQLETVDAMHNDAWAVGDKYWKIHKTWLQSL